MFKYVQVIGVGYQAEILPLRCGRCHEERLKEACEYYVELTKKEDRIEFFWKLLNQKMRLLLVKLTLRLERKFDRVAYKLRMFNYRILGGRKSVSS